VSDLEVPTFEDHLIAEGAVTVEQLERARRVAQRLREPRRPGDLLVEMGQLARAEYERVARSHRARLRLDQVLFEDGALDADGLARYAALRAASPHVGDRALLVDTGFVTEQQFLEALAAKHDVPFVEPDVGLVDETLLARTSLRYLERNRVLPLRIADGWLTAILADPLDPDRLADLERIYRVPVRACCATEKSILGAIHALRLVKEGGAKAVEASLTYYEVQSTEESKSSGEGAVAVLDYLLQRAMNARASDLHLEPLQAKVRVRMRVDGCLIPLTELPLSFAPQLVSRVKVLAGMDIAERRLHQDGRIGVRIEGREVDIRVSSYHSVFGETLVLRLLDRRRGLVAVEELGIEPRVLSTLRDIVLKSSSGLVLVTGPTGCGKTTTLYSFVDYVSAPGVKTITCEDPVEYVLDGVTQCSINLKAGLTFADSLKAMVRQDPDVIVVGEIRDQEPARLAVEAALTGHMVFSTFHTEDAVGASVRLTDMGVPPFLIASTMSCIVSQRLVRRVCPDCRVPAEPVREAMRYLGLTPSDLVGYELMKGEGCPNCAGTGFRGRVGVQEVLLPDDAFRDAILARAPSRELRKLARQTPLFLTLQEAGLLKAAAGTTTFAELVANVPRDSDARPLTELKRLQGGKGIL